MAITPHPITVTVYDNDNSTLLEGAKVYVRNTTKRSTTAEVATNSSGVAIIDLANLPLITGQSVEYEDGDDVLIIAYNKNDHDAVMYEVTGSSKSQTLYMNPARHNIGIEADKIKTLVVANKNASSNYYATVYAIDDGQVLSYVQCKADETVAIYYDGLPASGGYVVERENKDIVVTTCLK